MPELLIWYVICAVLIAAMTFSSIKFKFSDKAVFGVMAGVSFLSEMTKILTHMEETYGNNGKFYGWYLAPASLPFHLCSILIFVFAYLLLSNNEKMKKNLMEFAVPIGFLGGLLGVAFATSGTSFNDPSAYQSFLYHAMVIWFALHFMIKGTVYLGVKTMNKNLITMFFLILFALWMNSILRNNVLTDNRFVNFMFLAAPPMKGLPLLNLDHGWAAYFSHLIFVGAVLIAFVHSPFIIMEYGAKKKEKTNLETN